MNINRKLNSMFNLSNVINPGKSKSTITKNVVTTCFEKLQKITTLYSQKDKKSCFNLSKFNNKNDDDQIKAITEMLKFITKMSEIIETKNDTETTFNEIVTELKQIHDAYSSARSTKTSKTGKYNTIAMHVNKAIKQIPFNRELTAIKQKNEQMQMKASIERELVCLKKELTDDLLLQLYKGDLPNQFKLLKEPTKSTITIAEKKKLSKNGQNQIIQKSQIHIIDNDETKNSQFSFRGPQNLSQLNNQNNQSQPQPSNGQSQINQSFQSFQNQIQNKKPNDHTEINPQGNQFQNLSQITNKNGTDNLQFSFGPPQNLNQPDNQNKENSQIKQFQSQIIQKNQLNNQNLSQLNNQNLSQLNNQNNQSQPQPSNGQSQINPQGNQFQNLSQLNNQNKENNQSQPQPSNGQNLNHDLPNTIDEFSSQDKKKSIYTTKQSKPFPNNVLKHQPALVKPKQLLGDNDHPEDPESSTKQKNNDSFNIKESIFPISENNQNNPLETDSKLTTSFYIDNSSNNRLKKIGSNYKTWNQQNPVDAFETLQKINQKLEMSFYLNELSKTPKIFMACYKKDQNLQKLNTYLNSNHTHPILMILDEQHCPKYYIKKEDDNTYALTDVPKDISFKKISEYQNDGFYIAKDIDINTVSNNMGVFNGVLNSILKKHNRYNSNLNTAFSFELVANYFSPSH